jgi:excisionase family DNA binding protein
MYPTKVRLISLPQARALLDVSDKTIYRMIEDGRLESYREGPYRNSRHAITLSSVINELRYQD